MFKGHPKGLYALALANTGERFGYYTMLAIFTLFLQAKFGFDASQTGNIYSAFLAIVYFMPLLGGFLADRLGYGKLVKMGIVVMFLGYLLLSIPMSDSVAKISMFSALFLISVGTGLFKGNLQVLIGNLYDDPKNKANRDNGFSLFYMAINIGSMLAPAAATGVSNFFLKKSGFLYNADVPSLAREMMDGTISSEGMQTFAESAKTAVLPGHAIGDLSAFASDYINALSDSYNYGFGVACISLIVSMIIYLASRKLYQQADVNTKQAKSMSATTVNVEELTPAQTRARMSALFLVFGVVIVFWMSFQQSGLGLTLFAKEYTQGVATGFTRFGFDITALILVAVGVYAAFSTFQSESKKTKIISAVIWFLTFGGAAVKYFALPEVLTIRPEDFQQFNPFFIVIFTPFVMLLSTASAKKGNEISAPRKIGIGMVMAAAAYMIMAFASVNIVSRVSPSWLISTYFTLTLAELMLSPIGISFVTKVAPPKYKGMMMGCWFGVSAIGNYLTKVITKFWDVLPLWQVWSILIVLCCLSAIFMFSIMKRLESATSNC